tara:strand:- start:396 stop:992 length:597 start_codon:yes stop_codon:yes gene_type:complete
MSTLFVNNLNTATGSTITVPTGKKLVVTDTGGLDVPGTAVQHAFNQKTNTSGSELTTSSTTHVAVPNPTGTITPKFSDSTIIGMMTFNFWFGATGVADTIRTQIRCSVGGATAVNIGSDLNTGTGPATSYSGGPDLQWVGANTGAANAQSTVVLNFRHKPATTNQCVYQLYVATTNGNTMYINWVNHNSHIILMEMNG